MTDNQAPLKSELRLRILPDELKRRRLSAVLTQEELAEKAGLSAAAISYIEGGKRAGEARTIRALARALECDPLDIAEVVEGEGVAI